jgi:hypothetical protein
MRLGRSNGVGGDLGERRDAPSRGRPQWPRDGRILLETEMRARAHVIRDADVHHALPACGVEHDDMIEALAPNRPDEALDVPETTLR